KARAAARRDARDEESGAGIGASAVSHSGARLVRLSLRIPDGHAWNPDHASPLPRLRDVGRSARGTNARVNGVDGAWHDRRVRFGEPPGTLDTFRPAGR